MKGLPIALAVLLVSVATPAVAREHEGEAKEDPYYARADVHPPRGPGAYDPAADCAATDPAYSDAAAIDYTARQVQPWGFDPYHPNVAWAIPRCAAASSASVACPSSAMPCAGGTPMPVRARASYNVTSGNYSVLAWTPLLGLAGPAPAAVMGASGNSGVGLLFDCQGCPPPVLA